MKSKSRSVLFALGCALTLPVFAGDVACPDLATAVQVAACPTEDELNYTFTGYCSDNARMYGKDTMTCTSLENYKKLKNIALWEVAGGDFQAYVHCDLDPAAVKAAKPQRVSVDKAGKLTRVSCDYGDDVVFIYRTRSACQVEGTGACTDGKPCKVSCN
jgi:hypothetical protein